MSELIVPGIFAIAVAAVGAYGTYRLGQRNTSGSVDTSQAETLWDESRAMRAELRDEVVSLRAEVVSMRADTLQLQALAEVQKAELKRCREHANRCDRQLAALRLKVEQLSDRPRPDQ